MIDRLLRGAIALLIEIVIFGLITTAIVMAFLPIGNFLTSLLTNCI